MKTKNLSLIAYFSSLPWWISLVLAWGTGIFGFVIFDFVHLPLSGSNNILGILDQRIHYTKFRYIFLVIMALFLSTGAMSFWRSKKQTRFFEKQRNIASLKALSWQQFEHMVAEAYRRMGYHVKVNAQSGSDGGIDLILKKSGKTILIQCKRWKSSKVGVAVVREMYGLLLHHSADELKIVCVGEYTQDAHSFASGKPIELVTGNELVRLVRAVQ